MDERRAVAELNNPYAQIAAQEALRTALALQLGHRFGPILDQDQALLESLDRARLEELVVAAVEADSYDVWQARLQKVAGRK